MTNQTIIILSDAKSLDEIDPTLATCASIVVGKDALLLKSRTGDFSAPAKGALRDMWNAAMASGVAA